MVSKYSALTLCLVLAFCAAGAGQDYTVHRSGKKITLEVRARIHAGLPGFVFRIDAVKPDDYSVSATRIAVYKSDGKDTPVQTLDFEGTETADEERLGFIVEDMNFDGYNDIRIQVNNPAAPNNSYYCWVYNPGKGVFVEDCALEALISPVFDQAGKLVHSYERVSAAGYLTWTYRYVKGVLTLLGESEITFEPATGERVETIKELVDGKWNTKTIKSRE
jgi:hypothetical protein